MDTQPTLLPISLTPSTSQALTVTGGLMMLIALGPGSVSLDGEDKKNL
jgi:uncharacterized membrane protein YphA (DoxX/SURF4 family)